MRETALREIINNLHEEEQAENQMISLYLTLLDVGIEGCLLPERRASFRASLQLIYDESIKHRQIIQTLIKKYDV
ncbi:MAG: hypothetical protein WCK11_01010 [Candidatus Falkowbacteria bacterium]